MIEELYKKYLACNNRVSTDTRNITPGCIFFALKGSNFNGNTYAGEAIQKGARWAVIDDPEFSGKNTILVADVLKELQSLAKTHRKNNNFTVIGLTGTNGKTTTKDLIRTVLSSKYKCSATKGNLNNHIGVPLTILSADSDTEFLIIEMGANHIGEIKFLSELCSPDYGLITNIGKAHLEGFGGFNGVIKAKSELYTYLKLSNKPVFYNSNNELLKDLLYDYSNKIGYGSKEDTVYIESLYNYESLSLDLMINNRKFKINTQLFGKYNADNILAAVTIGRFFDVPEELIVSSMNEYLPSNRSQMLITPNNRIIADCYNANPSSMKEALNNFLEIDSERKVVILGEMKELGNNSNAEHKKIFDQIKNQKLFKALLVGSEFNFISASDNIMHFLDTETLADYLNTHHMSNCIILLKGSRSNGLEKLIPYF